jgi:hypothetical protein
MTWFTKFAPVRPMLTALGMTLGVLFVANKVSKWTAALGAGYEAIRRLLGLSPATVAATRAETAANMQLAASYEAVAVASGGANATKTAGAAAGATRTAAAGAAATAIGGGAAAGASGLLIPATLVITAAMLGNELRKMLEDKADGGILGGLLKASSAFNPIGQIELYKEGIEELTKDDKVGKLGLNKIFASEDPLAFKRAMADIRAEAIVGMVGIDAALARGMRVIDGTWRKGSEGWRKYAAKAMHATIETIKDGMEAGTIPVKQGEKRINRLLANIKLVKGTDPLGLGERFASSFKKAGEITSAGVRSWIAKLKQMPQGAREQARASTEAILRAWAQGHPKIEKQVELLTSKLDRTFRTSYTNTMKTFGSLADGVSTALGSILEKVKGSLASLTGKSINFSISHGNFEDAGIGGKNKKNKQRGGGLQRGGFTVPGSGDGDQFRYEAEEGGFVLNREASRAMGFQRGGVPVELEPGERYFPPHEAAAIGHGALSALNAAIPRFQLGGEPKLSGRGPLHDIGQGGIHKVYAKAKHLMSKLTPVGGAAGPGVKGLALALGPYDISPIQYDPDHAGGNSHWHIQMTSPSGAIAVGKAMQKMGFMVGEHPAFGGVQAAHSATGGHYDGTAIDVNSAADETRPETARVAAFLRKGMQKGGSIHPVNSAGTSSPAEWAMTMLKAGFPPNIKTLTEGLGIINAESAFNSNPGGDGAHFGAWQEDSSFGSVAERLNPFKSTVAALKRWRADGGFFPAWGRWQLEQSGADGSKNQQFRSDAEAALRAIAGGASAGGASKKPAGPPKGSTGKGGGTNAQPKAPTPKEIADTTVGALPGTKLPPGIAKLLPKGVRSELKAPGLTKEDKYSILGANEDKAQTEGARAGTALERADAAYIKIHAKAMKHPGDAGLQDADKKAQIRAESAHKAAQKARRREIKAAKALLIPLRAEKKRIKKRIREIGKELGKRGLTVATRKKLIAERSTLLGNLVTTQSNINEQLEIINLEPIPPSAVQTVAEEAAEESEEAAAEAAEDAAKEAESGSSKPTPGEETATLSGAREDLFNTFGSNVTSGPSVPWLSPPPTTAPSFSGLANLGLPPIVWNMLNGLPGALRGGGGRSGAKGGMITKVTNNSVTNHFAAPPPDPHTWTKQQTFELGALA